MAPIRSPIETYVRRNYAGILYTAHEAAEKVGRSTDTLRRWRRQGVFVPSKEIEIGKTTVYLYTEADIEAMTKMMKTIRPGRPRKEDTNGS